MAAVGFDGLFVEANSGWEKNLGHPAAGLAGKPCLDLVHPEDRERVAAIKAKLAGGGEQSLFEARFRCGDGSYKWLYMRCAADMEKRLIYVAASDITARKGTEDALRESEATLRRILDSAPMAMSIVNIDGTIEYINHKAVEVFGYPHPEIPDMDRWWALAYPDEAYRKEVTERWMGRVRAAWEKKSEIDGGEYVVTCKDGTKKTCYIFGVIAAGKVFVMFDDVSDRVNAANALRENAANLRRVLELAPVAMGLRDSATGDLEFINKAFTDTFGYALEDILSFSDWISKAMPKGPFTENWKDNWEKLSASIMANDGSFPAGEYEITCKDGTVKTAILRGVATPDGKILGIFEDVTARAEILRNLSESARTLDRIIEQAPIAMTVTSLDGKLELTNRKFTEVFGYTREDLADLETMARQAYPDEAYRREVMTYWANVAATVKPGSELPPKEFRVRCKDGSFRTVICSSVITPDGKVVTINDDVTARLQAEQDRAKASDALRTVLEQAPIAIMITDLGGNIVFQNHKQQETFGYTLQEAPDPDTLLKLAYPDPEYRRQVKADWAARVERSLRTGKEIEGAEYRIRCRNGERKTIYSTGIVLPDRRIVILSEDITARVEAEQALRERESLYRALIETTGTGYVILDGQGKVLDANREYVRLSGHADLKEIMGRSVVEWSAPADRDRAWEAVERVVRDGRVTNFELDYADKAGKLTHVEINATVVSRGGVRQILGLVRDVSARSKTEAQLRDSESLYRALVETTRTGYVVIDGEGRVLDANREYARLSGHSGLKEILGRSVTEWTAPDKAGESAAAMAKCARDGCVFNFETDYIDGKGKRTPVEINATLVSRGGKPQIHMLCRDITERRRTAEELKALNQGLEERVRERTAELSAANEELMSEISQRVQAEKDKSRLGEELLHAQKMEAVGRLAGGIAHDFNNILVSISGYAEFLLKSLPAGSQGRDDISEILLETEKGAALTRQLLTFSRKQPVQPKVLDLNEVAAESRKMLTRLIGANVRLETRLAPALDKISADPGQVAQVIMNLVINARDAMPDGGRITLETRNVEIGANYLEMRLTPTPGHYVMLSVSDTGSGMTREVLQHIFEPFYTTKEPGKGTGLGLPTVYGIVSQARGGLEVETSPGSGSVFKVYFPRTLDL
jgi:PAS domain S-box-containing protein